jgi:hypothetical protein
LDALKQDPFVLLSEAGLRAWRKMRETGVYTRDLLAEQHG